MGKLIEIKITKCLLVLTENEYLNGLKRGKAILRKRQFEKRGNGGSKNTG